MPVYVIKYTTQQIIDWIIDWVISNSISIISIMVL